jgi:rhamnose utilization protein RhaD (predicted bifunctional aldolase and dehydrogenase)
MANELEQLVAMSTSLGEPTHDYVILGEGNTSALLNDGTFWVKASGYQLPTIDAEGFVRVSLPKALAILEEPDLDDSAIKQRLMAAKVDRISGSSPAPEDWIRPSTETVFHAIALDLPGVNFVGHTHPTAINAITCSVNFNQAMAGRLFPDEIVMCGAAPLLIPYVDPGIPLAREIHKHIQEFIIDYNELPKVILMQNHGLIVLGSTAEHVLNITAMMVKTARVILGTYTMGGPHFLTEENVGRIHTRPDEAYRRKLLGGLG